MPSLFNYQSAKAAVQSATKTLSDAQSKVTEVQEGINSLRRAEFAVGADLSQNIAQAESRLTQAQQNLNVATVSLEESQLVEANTISSYATDLTTTIKNPEATLPSLSDITSAAKQIGSNIVGAAASIETGVNAIKNAANSALDKAKGALGLKKSASGVGGQGAGTVGPGAEPKVVGGVKISFKDASGKVKSADTRVKIRVPDLYLTTKIAIELDDLRGIIFPYTPTINVEHRADYQTVTPTHSNFPINFYHRSSIGNISISGKFTVQNDKDAEIYISTITLLRALTKMRVGTDIGAGSPPPVCRLDAFGTDMFNNVPVAVSSFRIELPESVDYYTYGKNLYTDNITSVPVISTISVVLLPMYSRQEMQKFNVTDFMWQYSNYSKQGYI